MKKNTLSIIALVIAVGALIFAFVTTQQLTGRIETLEKYNASLVAQVQQLSSRPDGFLSTSDNAVASSLIVESWSYTPGTLTITGGYAEVQLVAASTPDCTLTLKFNGDILHSQSLALTPDETGTAFAADLHGIVFELPELTGDDLLELWLDVNVGGESQSVSGVEWYLENGQLMMSAG